MRDQCLQCRRIRAMLSSIGLQRATEQKQAVFRLRLHESKPDSRTFVRQVDSRLSDRQTTPYQRICTRFHLGPSDQHIHRRRIAG